MAKCSATWYKSKARRIIRELRGVKQKELVIELNSTQPTISYAINHYWQEELERWLRLLNLLGYEVIRKEDEE